MRLRRGFIAPMVLFQKFQQLPIGYPKVNQDYVCLQKNGVSKVNQDLSVCFGEKESGGTSCFNDDRVIGLRNLVTERVVIGLCDLIVERDDIIRAISLPNAARPLNKNLHIQKKNFTFAETINLIRI